MSMVSTTSSQEIARRDALAERLFNGLLEAMELLSVQLGVELGLYACLHRDGSANAGELADRAGIHPRYSREWLEQQAAAGFLDTAAEAIDPDDRRFALPPGHAEALLDHDSPASVHAIAPAMIGIVGVLDQLVSSYRTGRGVSYAAFGPGIHHGIAGMNRPMFTNDLSGWLAAAPAVDQHLRSQAHPRILDIGCGTGWSTIALARTYPRAHVHALDLAQASVDDAGHNATEAGSCGGTPVTPASTGPRNSPSTTTSAALSAPAVETRPTHLGAWSTLNSAARRLRLGLRHRVHRDRSLQVFEPDTITAFYRHLLTVGRRSSAGGGSDFEWMGAGLDRPTARPRHLKGAAGQPRAVVSAHAPIFSDQAPERRSTYELLNKGSLRRVDDEPHPC